MTHRFVLVTVSLLFASTLYAADKKLPNIVIVLADDMGHGHVSHLNPNSKIRTPYIDKLASEGMSLTDTHSGSAVCSPTRYGILTGRYAWRTHLTSGVLKWYSNPLIDADRLTLPAMLKQKGYHTACIGKWHLGWDWPAGKDAKDDKGARPRPDFTKPIPGGPTARGFDKYFGTDVPNNPPYCFIDNDRIVGELTAEKTKRTLEGPEGPMIPGWKFDAILPTLGDRATEYIAERAKTGTPFFLYFPLTSPHEPISPSEAFRGKSKLNALGDFVLQTDDMLGRVMAAIEKAGIAKDTLLIFTADNGSSFYTGGKELQQMGHEPSAAWRSGKTSIYEGGHRVPFVARWPGIIPANSKSDETICLTDFMATFAGIVGASLPSNAAEDSFDILPALKSEKHSAPLREATVHQSLQGMLAIRQGKWKLILPEVAAKLPANSTEPTTIELYDLVADPTEKKNVAAENPAVVTKLKALLEQYKKTGRSRP